MVAFETSKLLAELLLSKRIEFAIAGGNKGVVAVNLSVLFLTHET